MTISCKSDVALITSNFVLPRRDRLAEQEANWPPDRSGSKTAGLEKGACPPGATTAAALAADLIKKRVAVIFTPASTCGKKGDIDNTDCLHAGLGPGGRRPPAA
jgi:hypothetical protein